MKRFMIITALLASTTFAVVPAYAAIGTANLNVSATVQNNCTVSADALSFGTYYNGQATDLAATADIDITCQTANLGLTISANDGANVSGANRRMQVGGEYLNYNLYKEVGHSNVWGGSQTLGTALAGTSVAGLLSVTIYGNIPAGQDVTAGNYTDTVAVSVEW